MKYLIVGLGSMGKRRIRNLAFLKAGTVIGFDLRADRRQETQEKHDIATFGSLAEALAQRPDALLVCTPPDLHLPYLQQAAESGLPFFSEINLRVEGLAAVADCCRARGILGAASCTLRFNPSIRRLKQLVDDGAIGRPMAMTYHSGQYLPDWHPWEDFRSFFAGRRATGACREIFAAEISWLTWLLGPIEAVSAMRGKVSDLPVDIDDVFQVVMTFAGGVLGHLLIDAVSRYPFRTLKVLGAEGVLTWEYREQQVRLYQAANQSWTVFPEPEPPAEPGYVASEGMYVEEMRHFLAALRGDVEHGFSLADEVRMLELLQAVEASSERGVQIEVRPSQASAEGLQVAG